MSVNEKGAHPIDELYPNKLTIFEREDRLRGLMALPEIRSGEIVFKERPFLWFGGGEDDSGMGLPLGLTRNIATKFPEALSFLQKDLKLRGSFRPKLTLSDKKILAKISRESGLQQSVVQRIYNLVCTYNVVLELAVVIGNDVVIGERICISIGLSFANHSCEPNCAMLAENTIESFTSNIVGLRAIRDIQAGEEITWNYIGATSASFKYRQRALKTKFGFYCNCSRCRRERNSP